MRRFFLLCLLVLTAAAANAQTATATLNDGATVVSSPNVPGVNLSYLNNYDTGQMVKNRARTYSWNFNQIISRQIMALHANGTSTSWTDPNIDDQPLQNYYAGGTALVEASQSNPSNVGCSETITANLGQTPIVSGSISGTTATFITSIASGFTPGNLFYVKNTSTNSYNQYTGGTITSVSGTTIVVDYTGSTVPTGTTTGGTVGQIGDNTFTVSGSCTVPTFATGDVITITQFVGPTPAAQWANNSSGTYGWPTGLSSDTTDLCATCGDQALEMNGLSAPTYNFSPFDAADQNINIFTLLNGTYTLSFWAKLKSGSATGLNIKAVRGGGVNCSFTPTLTTSWAQYNETCVPNEIGISSGNPNCKAGGPYTACTVPTSNVTITTEVNGADVLFDNLSFSNNADTNPTEYDQNFISSIQASKPGTLRFWVNQNAETVDNWTRPGYARDVSGAAGDYGGPVGAANPNQNLEDFLVLNQTLGTNPYIEIPVTFSNTEASELVDFLCGGSGTTYGARRIALGQTTPWCSVFSHIYLSFCNECWNGNFANQNLPDRGSAPSDQLYYDYAHVAGWIFSAMRATASFSSVIQLGFNVQTPVQAASTSIAVAKPDYIEYEGYWWNNNNSWDNSCGITTPAATNESCLWIPPLAQLYTVANGPVFNGTTHTGDPLNIYSDFQFYRAMNVCGASGTAQCNLYSYETGPGLLGSNNGVASPQADLDQANAGAGEAALTAITFATRVAAFNPIQNFFASTGYNNGGNNGNIFKGWGWSIDDGGATHNKRPEYYGFQMLTTSMIGEMDTCNITGTGTTISTPYLNYAGIGPGTGPGQNHGTSIVSALPVIYCYLFKNGSNRSMLLISADTTNTWTVNLAGTNLPSSTVTKRDFNPARCTSIPSGWGQLDCMNETYYGTGSTFETGEQVNTITSSVAAPSSLTLTPGELTAIDWTVGGTPQANTPTFSPIAGTYTGPQTITLSTSTSGCSGFIAWNTTGASTGGNLTGVTVGTSVFVSTSQTIYAQVQGCTGFTNSSIGSAAYTITAIAAAPVFSPIAGTYSSAQSVTLTTTTPSATICYAINTVPTAPTPGTCGVGSTTYTGPITVSTTQQVEALATEAGYTNSSVATAVYTIIPVAGTPTFSPAAGTYSSAQTVSISNPSGAPLVCYNTTGSIVINQSTTCPSGSTKYTSPVTVSVNETIHAVAGGVGFADSVQGTAAYIIETPAATPTFSPAGGIYSSIQSVAISASTGGSAIHYTTDGSTPTSGSPTYTAPITVSATTTIKAIAIASGFLNSAIGTATYTITLPQTASPSFSPVGGTYTSAQTVSVSSTTPSATIYCTTDGTTPTTSSPIYHSPFSVTVTTQIQCIATASGFLQSAVSSSTYTISTPTLASPVFSPGTGTYSGTQTVTLNGPVGAVICYAVGSTPTAPTAGSCGIGSVTYGAPFLVASSQTVSALATQVGFVNSSVSSATYTLTQPTAATPTFIPAAGPYLTPQLVSIATTTPSATIYYTIDGSTPTTSSPVYSGPFLVSSTTTVSAIAVATGYINSAVGSATYTLPAAAGITVVIKGASVTIKGSGSLK